MKFRVLLILFIITLAIGGCKQAEPLASVQSETPLVSVQSEVPESPVQSVAPPSPAPSVYVDSVLENFHIAIATEELLGQYASYYEYAAEEIARIIIWTDTVVKDFAFISVNNDETGDQFTFSEGEILFSLDEFTPDKPFVADIFSPEIFPVNGISFRDVYGVKRYFFIQADGRGIEEAPPYHFREFENGGPQLTEAETVPLTAEELAAYNTIFENQLYDEQGNPIPGSKPISQFLTSYYDRPQDINLVKLLWNLPCDGLVTDETEFQTLKDAENWNFSTFETLDSMPVPIHKHSAATVDKALKQYMGISLEDHSGIGTEKLPYLKASDTYYTFASDPGGESFACVSGERQGELVRLYSQDAILTLKLHDDGFWFVSHQPA
jgi:hypothetical protein